MAKIPISLIIADFRTMLRERWAYGAQTKRGQADCSGAFVWSYGQHGHSVYHGSNRIAREETEGLIPLATATPEPGMACFKVRAPGAPGYALPGEYKPGGSHYNGDLNDYYHIGLIDEDVSRVLNAQSAATGFVASPIGQNWSHVAYLRQAAYPGRKEENPLEIKEVWAGNGQPVNLREKPSTASKRLSQVPVGTPVTVHAEEGDWAEVTAEGKRGYMMLAFLRQPGSFEERLRQLEDRIKALENVVKVAEPLGRELP